MAPRLDAYLVSGNLSSRAAAGHAVSEKEGVYSLDDEGPRTAPYRCLPGNTKKNLAKVILSP